MRQGERAGAARALSIVLVLGLTVATACAQAPASPPALLGPVTGVMPAGDPGTVVAVDAAGLEREPATLRLRFSTGVKEAVLDRIVRRGPGRLTWFGRTDGSPGANVVVTVVDGQVAATVETAEGTLALTPAGNGRGRLHRPGGSGLTARTERVVPAPAAPAALTAVSPPVTTTPAVLGLAADDPRSIDVMIAYGAAMADRYGEAAIPALAQNAVDRSNIAFYASRIGAQLRLVGVNRVTESAITTLDALQGSPAVAAVRAVVGADLVQAWGTYPGMCGQAFQNQGGPVPAWGFSVVHVDCVMSVAPTHEWGHNLGAGHDHLIDGPERAGDRALPDAWGHTSPDGDFATIMAYDNPACPGGSCGRIYHFSNPYVTWAGVPTGQVGYANNARAIRLVAPLVSAYRPVAR